VSILQKSFKEVRQLLGLSQSEFGDLLGVDGNYIYQIESGKKPVSDRKPLGVLFSLLQKSPQAVMQLIKTDAIQIQEGVPCEEPGEYGLRKKIMPEGAFDALSQFAEFSMTDCTAQQVTSALQWILRSNIREPYKNALANEFTRILQIKLSGKCTTDDTDGRTEIREIRS